MSYDVADAWLSFSSLKEFPRLYSGLLVYIFIALGNNLTPNPQLEGPFLLSFIFYLLSFISI